MPKKTDPELQVSHPCMSNRILRNFFFLVIYQGSSFYDFHTLAMSFCVLGFLGSLWNSPRAFHARETSPDVTGRRISMTDEWLESSTDTSIVFLICSASGCVWLQSFLLEPRRKSANRECHQVFSTAWPDASPNTHHAPLLLRYSKKITRRALVMRRLKAVSQTRTLSSRSRSETPPHKARVISIPAMEPEQTAATLRLLRIRSLSPEHILHTHADRLI